MFEVGNLSTVFFNNLLCMHSTNVTVTMAIHDVGYAWVSINQCSLYFKRSTLIHTMSMYNMAYFKAG
ncbi:hypothetical protein D3C76_1543020 [compost metagenome]